MITKCDYCKETLNPTANTHACQSFTEKVNTHIHDFQMGATFQEQISTTDESMNIYCYITCRGCGEVRKTRIKEVYEN